MPLPIEKHLKHIVKISTPIIIGQLGMILTGFFDNLMVGKLGYNELAAAGICNSIYFLIAVFPLGVTIAYATVTSILQGKNKINSGNLVFRDSALITILLSILTTIILFIAISYFPYFNQTEAVNKLSQPYLKLLALSCTPMLFFSMVKNISDGYGYTKAGMIITLSSLLINIFFNWVFIYGNLGSEAYGLNGAGYATIISRVFAVIGISVLLFSNKNIPIHLKSLKQISGRYKNYRFFKQILRLGIPSGLQYFFEVAAFAFAALMAGWIGAKELAAHQLAISIAAVTYMFASGISSGVSISVANVFGRGQFKEVRTYSNVSLKLTGAIMLVFALVFVIFRTRLAYLFATDPDVIDLGRDLLLIAAIFQLSDGVQAVSLGLLRGIEDVKLPSLLTLVAYWVVAIPIAYFLGIVLDYGVRGIWIGLTLGLSCSAALLCIRFYKQLRSKQK